MSKYLNDAGVEDIASAIKAKADATYAPKTHGHPAAQILGLATVATSGSYNDLANKPETGNTTVFYGECATAASTQAKAVSCAAFTSSDLAAGTVIYVKMTNNQSYNGAPTLNVNSTGAVAIKYQGTTNAVRYEWRAGEVICFIHDGTNWIINDDGRASTSYYGVTKLSTSATSTSTDLAAAPSAINSLVQNMIEPYAVYSSSSTYAVGDRVRYNYQAWECTTAITTAESWNAAHWTALPTIQDQLDAKPDTTDFATVATTGAYSDLSGKPTIPSASSANPQMDGTASAGTSANYARADHVHPTDTSRAASSHSHTQTDMTNGAFAWFATCSTGSSVADKVATCTGYELRAGAIVFVQFSYYSNLNAPLTLNVNNTGAKPIYIDGVDAFNFEKMAWYSGDVLEFVYDGTAYEYIGGSEDMGYLDHPKFAPANAAAVRVGRDGLGHVVLGSALTAADVGANAVSIVRNTTSGTNIADITIDGTTTKLYAPTSGGGGPSPSSATPQMDGTASAGSSTDYARGDHVHPTDTSRAASVHSHTASEVSGLADVAYSGDYDDIENTPSIPAASSTTPSMDGTGAVGTSIRFARADHVHPSDTGKSDVGHNHDGTYAPVSHEHAATDITSGTLGIANGGTGQSSVSTVSTVSTLITAASGTTISAATFKQWGKLAMLTVSFKRTSSWAANAQVDVGTVKTGYRPAVIINGGNANVLAHLNGAGVIKARNMTGAAIATTTQQDIGFTFLLP